MNTKVVIVLPDWQHLNAATIRLRLSRHVSTDILVFTKPSPWRKRHAIVKVPLPTIKYWVIDKDTFVKVSSTHVKSVASSLDVGKANSESEIASQWLPTSVTLTIIDPNQPEPLMKFPISIEQD